MEEGKEPVKVTVAGGSYGANTLVYGVIHDALHKAGFRALSPSWSAMAGMLDRDKTRIASLLDICRSIHPDLFNTPVAVAQDLQDVRFTDDEVYPTTAALEETIHKVVRSDYVDYYTEVTDTRSGNGRHDVVETLEDAVDAELDAPPTESGPI
jgi:hypothetical protein